MGKSNSVSVEPMTGMLGWEGAGRVSVGCVTLLESVSVWSDSLGDASGWGGRNPCEAVAPTGDLELRGCHASRDLCLDELWATAVSGRDRSFGADFGNTLWPRMGVSDGSSMMSAAAEGGGSCCVLEGCGLTGVEVDRTLEGWKMEGAVMGMFIKRFMACPNEAPVPPWLLSRRSSLTLLGIEVEFRSVVAMQLCDLSYIHAWLLQQSFF